MKRLESFVAHALRRGHGLRVRRLPAPVGDHPGALSHGTRGRSTPPPHRDRAVARQLPHRHRSRVSPGGTALFVRQLFNSLVVSIATAAAAILVATPAAYALARFPFVGSKSGLRALLATQMFPTVASAVPLYLLLDAFHLLDSRAGLVLVYASTAVPFAIFQLRGAFLAIPVDIEEAAMVDGASRARAFFLVVLPAARPAIAVTALFAFMSAWNEFILAATLLSQKSATRSRW